MSLIALIIAGKLPGSDEYVECSDAKDRKFFSAIRLCADRPVSAVGCGHAFGAHFPASGLNPRRSQSVVGDCHPNPGQCRYLTA